MKKITNDNLVAELSRFLLGQLSPIDDTNLVYELISIDDYEYVAVRHDFDNCRNNTYYELESAEIALSSQELEQCILETFIQTEMNTSLQERAWKIYAKTKCFESLLKRLAIAEKYKKKGK